MEKIGLFRGDSVILKSRRGAHTCLIVLSDSELSKDDLRIHHMALANLEVKAGDVVSVEPLPDLPYADNVELLFNAADIIEGEDLRTLVKRFFSDAYRPVMVGNRMCLRDPQQGLDDGRSFLVQAIEASGTNGNCAIVSPHTSFTAYSTAPASAAPPCDEATVNDLIQMGFPPNACKKAVIQTGNAGSEAAVEWIMQHMDDPDFDALPPEEEEASAGGGEVPVDQGSVEALMSMGFNQTQCEKALRSTGGDLERATDWIVAHPDED